MSIFKRKNSHYTPSYDSSHTNSKDHISDDVSKSPEHL
jgi:hypothetical protein